MSPNAFSHGAFGEVFSCVVAKRPLIFDETTAYAGTTAPELEFVTQQIEYELGMMRGLPPHGNVIHPLGVLHRDVVRQRRSVRIPEYVFLERCDGDLTQMLSSDAPLEYHTVHNVLCDIRSGLSSSVQCRINSQIFE